MSTFERALDQLPPPLRAEVQAHWASYLDAAQRAGITPPDARLDQLVKVWAGSDFVARACCREPAMLTDLMASGDLATPYGAGAYGERLARWLQGVTDEEPLSAALRRFRRREMVRITWRDLADLAPLPETLAELSELAGAVTEAALQRLYQWQGERFGTPRDAQGQAQPLVVLGMGKLGGRELNFSSDIDLIFIFPQRGETDGRRSLTNEEFFRRLAQRLIRALDQPTAEGFVFRVDMRLRPFGDSGPLVMSFNAFQDYYQNHGRDWERYAMIKARVIAGDQEAGGRLLDTLRPFVYRRYLDYGAIEALRAMKAMIAKEVARKGMQRNIKLGPGGIREIEFIGQVFQLIYGGREPALRERSILRVLDCLGQTGRLPAHAVAGLKEAYVFLRRVENRLQAWADQQTHNLPEEPAARLRLAYAMGFADWPVFAKALERHLALVSSQFDQIFAAPQTEPGPASEAIDFAAVWSGAAGEDNAIQYLQDRSFEHPALAWQRLRELRNGLSYRSLSQRGRERMDQLIPLLLGAAAAGDHSTVALERIVSLLSAVARRSVYLSLLIENPLALSQLVRLSSASPWIAKYLTRYPLLLDDLLDPVTLYRPPNRFQLETELTHSLDKVHAGDTEQVMDALRHFKQTQMLRVAAADISGALPLMVVSDHLTWIAEVLLEKVLALAWTEVTRRYGLPRYQVGERRQEAGFAIVAYGKLGGIELNYSSDLDLVFLHDSTGERQHTDGPRQLDNATFFLRLVQRIIHLLTTRTAAGELYEVDMRLRPSGRSGLLVSSLDAFAEYQRHQAWTWEHQALARARVVAGSATLVEQFGELRREVLGQERDSRLLQEEVREMRQRMREELSAGTASLFDLKQDRGGIADIEFMVQYMILANAHRHPELLTYTDNIRQLDGLEQVGILSGEDAGFLRDAYRALRRCLHRLTLQEQPGLIPASELQNFRDGVVRLWRRLMEQD